MALISKKTAQDSSVVQPGSIPNNATHVIWYRWAAGSSNGGKTVIQFANTQRSAKLAYGKAEKLIGEEFPWGSVEAAGWSAIMGANREFGMAL